MGRIHLEAMVFADPDDDRTLALRRQRLPAVRIACIGGVLLVLLAMAGGMQRYLAVDPAHTPLSVHIERAEHESRPLLLYFTGDSCAACVRMQEEVFDHPERRRELDRRFVVVPVHRKAPEFDELSRSLDVAGFPTLIVTAPSLVPLSDASGAIMRHTGYLDPRMMREFVERPINTRRFRASGGEMISRRSGDAPAGE